MTWSLLLLPLISAFIGWLTNLVAIKMLFHPKEPIMILGYPVQGVFPKRQAVFAQKLGKLVNDELLSFDDISAALTSPDELKSVLPLLDSKIDDFIKNRLAKEIPLLSMFISDKLLATLKASLMQEVETMLPELMQTYSSHIRAKIDLQDIVTRKVSAFSSDKLEEILNQIMASEFKFIEIVGAVLGAIIGLLQVAITYWTI